MSSNTVSNELPNGQAKTVDFSNQDKNATNMHASSSQTKQDPIDKSSTSLQERNNLKQNHENTLNKQFENKDQNSQKDQSDETPSSPSKEDLQLSNTDANTFDDGSKSGRNFLGHSKKQGSREYHSGWKSRNSVQQTKQPKNKRKDDVKPEPLPLQDLNSWPTLEQARSTENVSKKVGESTTPKSPKANPFNQSGDEKQDEGEILSPKKKGINWVPFKDTSGTPIPSELTSGNSREVRTGNNSSNRGPRGSRRRSDKDNTDDFYQRPPREGQQNQGGNSQGRNWRGQFRNSGNRGYSRQYNTAPVGNYPQYLYTLEGDQLRETALYQIEYYYSIENLVRDVWLRQQWDEEGWLPLSVLASFPRIRALTTDISVLSEALKYSTILEFKDDKIRKLDDWKNWSLPKSPMASIDSPITSPKSNEQNIPISNSVSTNNSDNISSSGSNTSESSENSQSSPSTTPAPNSSQNQPATRTYASLASADALKQKQANSKPQQRKQESLKKATATPPSSQSSATQPSSASQPPKQKSEQKSDTKTEPKTEPKKQDSTPSEQKKENTTETKPTTEEGEWQTVEAKKRRTVQKAPSGRSSKDLPKKFEEMNGVGDENHVVSPNAARKEKSDS